MQWSKLKSRVERFFAASVSGRVEVRTTSYRHAHAWEGRGWIQGSFEHALEDYLSMPVGVALESGCLLHRALAVIDSRVGKRRLQKIVPRAEEHPLVIRLLEFRCAQEKIGSARDIRSVGGAAG